LKKIVLSKENTKPLVLLLIYLVLAVIKPTQTLFIVLIANIFPGLFHSDIMISVVMYAIPIILTIIFYGKYVLQSFSYFKDGTLKKILYMIGSFFVIMIANYGINLLTTIGNTENQAGVEQVASSTPMIWTALLFGILIPLIEEIIFRKILIDDLSKFINEKIAIAISLLTFALLHVDTNIIDAISYMPIAIILTIAYIASNKNIAYTWSLHMLNNLVGLVLIPLMMN